MIDHRTFVTNGESGISLFNLEAKANATRQQLQTYINQYLTPLQIITITEAWNPNNTVSITVWFDTMQTEPTPTATQMTATPHSENAK